MGLIGNRSNHRAKVLTAWEWFSVQTVLSVVLLMACGSSNEKGAPADEDLIPEGMLLTLVDECTTAALEDTLWAPGQVSEIRGRVVQINPVVFTHYDTLAQGNHLMFNLFENEHFSAVITRSTVNSAGILSISGKLSGLEASWFTMSVDSSRLLANVYLEGPKRHYVVYYSGKLCHHVVVERDPALKEVLPEHPPVIPPDTLDHQ